MLKEEADVPFSVGGLAKATFIGAASAAVTFGIGSAATNLFSAATTFSKAAFQAVAHGMFQGTMSGIQGGKFFSSFVAGALSSIAASAFSWDGNGTVKGLGWASSVRDSGIGMIAFGTLSSGSGAALTGGNFWQGAVTGLVVSGLNHAMHKMVQRSDLIGRLKAAGYNDPRAYANLSDSELAGFAQKVLPELYAEAHSPKFESRDIPDSETNGFIDASGKPVFKGPILLAKSSFLSYFKLASTMGHELNHAADYFNGNNLKWLGKGEGYRHATSELKAYRWEANIGGEYNVGQIQSYVNEQYLWNKFSNF